ncbi:MAG: histidine phosphatase family protein [Flavobacteriales bacterium]|nr:histidine phosphatase family protein [Flavobacteriales bacterium]
MIKLILVRHAKSSWNDLQLADVDRPLNDRGKKNAPLMAEVLKSKKILPDIIYCSKAKRSRSTAKRMANVLFKDEKAFEVIPEIYEAEIMTLLHIVNRFQDKYKTIMLIGHNPGLTEFLNYLTEAGIGNIPTTGVAEIHFPFQHWKEISRDTGNLVYFDYPKNYPS